jgi:hypothetical protein
MLLSAFSQLQAQVIVVDEIHQEKKIEPAKNNQDDNKLGAGGKSMKDVVKKVKSISNKEKGTIFFEHTTFNFGKIKEVDGTVYHVFNFKNIGKGELKVLNVKAACGCTTPKWSNTPMKTDETGYIRIGFSPLEQSGRVEKSLEVTTNGTPERVYISFTADVEPKDAEWKAKTPQVQGNMRVQGNSIRFTTKDSHTDSFVFSLYNQGKSAMEIHHMELPSYFTYKVVKPVIPAGEGTNIIFRFNPYNAQYGPNERMIKIITTDDVAPVKEVMTWINLEQDFSKVKFKGGPPKVVFKDTIKDFGELFLDELVEYDFEVSNAGKSDLIIRRAYGTCGCTVTHVQDSILKKGAKTKIHVVFNTKNIEQQTEKTIQVITNDPSNPVAVLRLRAFLLDPGRSGK